MQDFEIHRHAIEGLLNRIRGIYDPLVANYGSNDLRPVLFAAPGNTLRSLHIFLGMAISTVTHESWWNTAYGPTSPTATDLGALSNLETMTRYSFFVYFVSQVEWSMRKLVTYASPGSCGNGKATFNSIYTHLLTSLNLPTYIPLYRLASTVRNCIHSNGIFVPKEGPKDIDIGWKEVTYQFRYEAPIDFMTYETISQLYVDLIDSLEQIVGAPAVASLKAMPDAKNKSI